MHDNILDIFQMNYVLGINTSYIGLIYKTFFLHKWQKKTVESRTCYHLKEAGIMSRENGFSDPVAYVLLCRWQWLF